MSEFKISYIISDIDKALAFEWIATYINRERFRLSFILLNPGNSALERFLQENSFETYRITCRGKKDWPQAIWHTYKLLKKINPDAVHCHLIQANTIGLVAARMAGIPKRIYTRHHSSLHHIYFPKGVWWDKLANRLATHIIAISGIVKDILLQWEKVPAEKVILIPHGFLLSGFTDVPKVRVKAFIERHGLEDQYPVIGVIARFTEWKGVQFTIQAFQQLLSTYPSAILLLLNAQGDYEKTLHKQLEAIPQSNFRLIPFEKDIAAAYRAMNVFVHVPIDEHSEAFGQIYVEALAAGVPSVFTRSGIANEPYFNDEVAVMVSHKNIDEISQGIKQVIENPVKKEEKIQNGKKVAQRFDLSIYIKQLESLYPS